MLLLQIHNKRASPIHQLLAWCDYCVFEIWLVQIEMCCMCNIHNGFEDWVSKKECNILIIVLYYYMLEWYFRCVGLSRIYYKNWFHLFNFTLKKYLFIYLAVPSLSCSTRDLFVVCGIFSCGMQDLVPWPGIEPRSPALGARSLNHWTTREVPNFTF